MARNIIYSRAILYSDASGTETGVTFDPTYRIEHEDQSYVEVQGVGGAISVRVDHIPHLIKWLREVEALDWDYMRRID